MFQLSDLKRPVIVAPMAGGASTPELVSAAAAAGGMGFLAAGYKSVDALTDQISTVRSLGADPFGVNLFVPDPRPADLEAARRYRHQLAPLAEHYGIELPEPRQDDDGWSRKVEALLDLAVPAVSFTFGCPDAEVVRRFRERGTTTIATVTNADEATQAEGVGVDVLALQGPDAGGHRATFDARQDPSGQPLTELFDQVATRASLPTIVAGGITTRQDVSGWLERAAAVQLGTAFLDADEAGTQPAYRQALHETSYTETALTRAFSGRWARGLRNEFIDRYSALAPDAYPAVNQLTGALRGAAGRAGDAQNLSLWAGTGWRSMPSGSTAAIMAGLTD
ncbi:MULTISPECIES: nitronate monooxygenase [unclassified Luteococcus]|uniref:nitronate monooxygenase n=1 Tax=unclassified Luteococcus TaxID=2639923 RepID=UPI00313CFA3F